MENVIENTVPEISSTGYIVSIFSKKKNKTYTFRYAINELATVKAILLSDFPKLDVELASYTPMSESEYQDELAKLDDIDF